MDYRLFKILTWVPREARGGLEAIAGKREQPYYHFINTVLGYFLFLLTRVLFSLPGYDRNHLFQHIDIVGLSQAEL